MVSWPSAAPSAQPLLRVSGKILWLNIHRLFCLCLRLFSTDCLGTFALQALFVALYGLVLFLRGLSFELLRRHIDQQHVNDPITRAWHEQASTRYVLVLHGI